MLMPAWERQMTTGLQKGFSGCLQLWNPRLELPSKRQAWAILASIHPKSPHPIKTTPLAFCPAHERMLTYVKICNLPGIFYTSGHGKCLLWIRMLKMQLHNRLGNLCVFPPSAQKVNFDPSLFRQCQKSSSSVC